MKYKLLHLYLPISLIKILVVMLVDLFLFVPNENFIEAIFNATFVEEFS